MPQLEVTLPSGAKGRIRGLKGREINIFANQSAAKKNKITGQVLANVWLETLESGELYDGEVDWKKAPQCDRFAALFYARIATYGPKYSFHHKCSECGSKYIWDEDLEQREIKPLPEKSIECFKASNRFTTVVTDPEGADRRVVFQLLTPQLEDKMARATSMAPMERATLALAQRIVSVEGLEDGKTPIKRFLEDLDAMPLFDLIEAMDDVDGGIDTAIEIDCPHCGAVEDLELPLEGEFWSPPKRKRSTDS